jgi:sRNA-binding protein
METKLCSVCGAKWIDGQHYWSGTAKKGNELDLAGLVCNNLPEEKRQNCANPCKGMEGGTTWAKRLTQTNNALGEFEL